MSNIEITYDGAPLAYDVPPTKINVPQRAELGSISMGGLGIEDPTAALALVGHRPIYVEELDCSQPRLFTGWVADRNIGRSFEQTQFVGASARIHDTTIVCLNACFGFRIITGADGNRPAEFLEQRLAWILGSAYLAGLVDDTGKCPTSGASDPMDATDYRGQYPDAVLSDLNDRTGNVMNYFAFWDPAPATGSPRPGLFFDRDDEAVSTLCPISISNVLTDVDGATCFAPNGEARLERTPETVYSDVILDYAGGSVYRTLASTETAHIKRGTSISRPHTGQASTATTQADSYLGAHANEVDRITPTIHVPSSVVGLLWAGQRMDVKFSHLPGYVSWASMRIVASTPRPVDDLADWYDVDLELVSPRVEATGTLACTTGSLVFLYDSGGAQRGRPPTSFTIPAPPVLPSVMLAFVLANEPSTSVTDTVGSHISLTAPWTLLQYVPAVTYEHDLVAAGYLVTPSGTPADFTVMWTDNGWSTSTHTTVVGVYIETSATAPVQVADDLMLPAPPTEGNLLVLAVASGTSGAVTSLAGWQHIRTSAAGGDWQVDIFSRCVGTGESATVVAPVSPVHKALLSEWALSGVSTTGGIIPPKPGETTVVTTNPAAVDDSDHGYVTGVHWVNTADGQEFVLVDSTVGAAVWTSTTAAAPPSADYLVGTAQAGLSAEIVVGTTPGGELGGTWASPTVDTTHSGSAHSAYVPVSVMTTLDDIIVGGASGAPGRLGKGSDGQVLTVDPTTHSLVWASAAGGAPTGAAGGELAGTYPNPTVAATHAGSAHHTQAHDHSAAGDGTALAPASVAATGAVTGSMRHLGSYTFNLASAPGTSTVVMMWGDATLGMSNARVRMPWSGSIVGIAIHINGARTAGTLIAKPDVGGTPQAAPVAQVDGTNTSDLTATAAIGTTTFAANQGIGVDLVGSSFTPTSNIVTVILYVMFDGMAS